VKGKRIRGELIVALEDNNSYKWDIFRLLMREKIDSLKYNLKPFRNEGEIGKSYNERFVKPVAKFVGIVTGITWGTFSGSTGKFLPSNISAELNRQQIERVEYNKLEDKLFGINGLVDINGDGKIQLTERAGAYERMGINDKSYFVKPTKEELQKGIASYETDKKRWF